MNNLDKQYQELLQDILDNGVEKKDRTGIGTLSVFGRQIRHKMSEGYPLLTTKKMYFKGIVTELLWFLRGDTNIKYLIDNDCHIWVGDAYKKYVKNHPKGYYTDQHKSNGLNFTGPSVWKDEEPLTQEEFINKIKTDDEFTKKWGDLGPIYGKQWRHWGSGALEDKYLDNIDQIQNLIEQLKTNPDSRRLMVSAWNVGELDQMTLPPCHYGFQVYTRELTEDERMKIWTEYYPTNALMVSYNESRHSVMDNDNIPKRAISLMWNQRSVDTFLGLPFNIASYGLLLEIIGKEVNMVPDELIGNLGDVHLYKNHIEQAKEQIGRELSLEERIELIQPTGMDALIPEARDKWMEDNNIPTHTREPMKLPHINNFVKDLTYVDNKWKYYEISNFEIENYESHPPIKAPLNN